MATQSSIIRHARLLWLFYFHYPGVPALITTTASGVFLAIEPSLAYIKYNLAMKVIVTGLLLTYVEVFRRGPLYFFFNLGIHKAALYGSSLVIDLTIWAAIASTILRIS